MKSYWLHKGKSDKLIVFFCGWGQDQRPFLSFESVNWDVLMLFDYSEASFPEQLLEQIEGYSDRILVAWSMGVFMADNWLKSSTIKFRHKIAINGTLKPVDNDYGIPKPIYEGTTANFSEITRHKFFRRMCGDSFIRFIENMPEREIGNQKEELVQLQAYSEQEAEAKPVFDTVLIGEKDLIFPTKNQQAYWETVEGIKVFAMDVPHFPFYNWGTWGGMLEELGIKEYFATAEQDIKQKIDKALVAERFQASLKTYHKEADIQKYVAKKLFLFVTEHEHKADRILEIGCGTGFLTKRLDTLEFTDFYLNDLVEESVKVSQELSPRAIPLVGDIEQVELPENLDLVASSATLQWLEDFPAFMEKLKVKMNKGGLFAFSTFGKDNMREIRELTGFGLSYVEMEALKQILSKHFEILYVEEERIPFTFNTPLGVLKHLRKTGVTGIKRQKWNRTKLEEFSEKYKDKFAKSHKVKLTYHPMYFILRVR